MTSIEDISEIPATATIVLPPHGFINLEWSAPENPDLWVANCARVSLRKRQTEADESTEGLIRYLLQNRHGTPFEHNSFCFHVRAPIGVLREWQRHRIGVSYNEESTRYVDVLSEGYVPEGDALRTQTGRVGHYRFETIDNELERRRILGEIKRTYDEVYVSYNYLNELGLAREVSRNMLPLGHYSQMIFTCNARSIMNFVSLRSYKTALYEIRAYSDALFKLWSEKMPITARLFSENTAEAVAKRIPDMLIAP